jgi:hypothetical protein
VGSAERGLRRGKAGILKCAMSGRLGRILAKEGIKRGGGFFPLFFTMGRIDIEIAKKMLKS